MLIFELVFLLWMNQKTEQQPLDQTQIQQVVASGRAADVAQDADQEIAPPKLIAPGLPPMLSFRYYEDKKNQRFANLDLMLDDAGH